LSGPGRLSVVGTPIGNLEDASPRMARVLAEADVVYCEDTRRTRKLLSALGIGAPRLARLDANNEEHAAAKVVAAVAAGAAAVVVSDAGMPTVSDPGAAVVRAVAGAGLPVEVVPGPSAAVAALAVSGLPASQFRFFGFLARKGAAREKALGEIAASAVTSVVFEAAGRVRATIGDLAAACGSERPLVAARELTKAHEEVWRGSAGEAVGWVAGTEPRGEWVLLVAGCPQRPPASEEEILAALRDRLAAGLGRREAVAEVASELGAPRRTVYALALQAVALRAGGEPP
jgi:16S rRNA (cytidine1402-2'-O)-methyltransferase